MLLDSLLTEYPFKESQPMKVVTCEDSSDLQS